MFQRRLDREWEQYLWSTTRLGYKPCTDTDGLVRRSHLQRTTTTGLISRDAGEHCLVFLRAGNKRQRSEDFPLRWNRCSHHLQRGVLLEKRVLWQLVKSHPVRNVLRRYWATYDMARDGTWVPVDAGWYGPESCGLCDGVAD